jgi:DNA-binding response OmpR family regulator
VGNAVSVAGSELSAPERQTEFGHQRLWTAGDVNVSDEEVRQTGRVLVIEDDPLQAEGLAVILRQEGYRVDLAATAIDGLTLVHGSAGPDVILLDVALPDLSGVEVARRLRAGSNVPIIMLTARRQEVDKVTSLDAGADDYVTKPFSPNELLARIRAQLRRGSRESGAAPPASGVFSIGELRVDVGVRRLTCAGAAIRLSAREFEIVRVLAEAAGQVVERRDLFARVWGTDFYGEERALDVYMRMLRKKIERDPARPTYLHTVRGVGFRLADERPTVDR